MFVTPAPVIAALPRGCMGPVVIPHVAFFHQPVPPGARLGVVPFVPVVVFPVFVVMIVGSESRGRYRHCDPAQK